MNSPMNQIAKAAERQDEENYYLNTRLIQQKMVDSVMSETVVK